MTRLPTDLSEDRARAILAEYGEWSPEDQELIIRAMHQYAAGLQAEATAVRTQRNEVIEECARIVEANIRSAHDGSDLTGFYDQNCKARSLPPLSATSRARMNRDE